MAMKDKPRKAYRQQAKQVRKTARVEAQKLRATGRVISRGEKLMKAGDRVAGRAQSRISKEVSRGVRSGEVRGGPRQSSRFRMADADVMRSTGADMKRDPEKYVTKRAGIKLGVERTVRNPGVTKKSGRVTNRLSRTGRPVQRKK